MKQGDLSLKVWMKDQVFTALLNNSKMGAFRSWQTSCQIFEPDATRCAINSQIYIYTSGKTSH